MFPGVNGRVSSVKIRHLKPGAKTGSSRKADSISNKSASVGRPSDYKPEFADQAYKLALLGGTDRELADFFGVSEQTLNTWKKKHPKFLESLKRGKDVANANVASRLYERAMGYSHPAVKIMQSEGTSFEHTYTEHYPPDTAAAIFFLKNRRPDLWRDKQQHEHSGPGGQPIQVEDMTADEIRRELEKRGALNGAGHG